MPLYIERFLAIIRLGFAPSPLWTMMISRSCSSSALSVRFRLIHHWLESSTWPLLERAGRFCINVLASDQTDLCRQLATPGPDKFAGVGYTLSTHGAPLLDGALAWIDCTLHDVLEAGDHYVVLGKVEHLDVSREGDPMLFFRGRYGGFRELM
jgi:flavin reductase (DIM6/NTAB) family NADH-FMN oxidoreductase RutF